MSLPEPIEWLASTKGTVHIVRSRMVCIYRVPKVGDVPTWYVSKLGWSEALSFGPYSTLEQAKAAVPMLVIIYPELDN